MKMHTMVRGMALGALLSISFGAQAGEATKATKAAQVLDRIAAVVNGKLVTLSEVEDRIRLAKKLGTMAGSDHLAQQKRALGELIDEGLLEAEIEVQAVQVAEAEIDAAIAQLRKQNNLDEASFERAITMQGYTLERYREEVRGQLKRARLINAEVRAKVQVSDAEVDAALKQKGAAGAGQELRARHILIKVAKDAPAAEVAAAKAKILGLKKQLEEGGVEFDLLARDHSEDTGSAPDGGDLGWFSRGMMVGSFEAAAFAAKAGTVVGPIRTLFGFHLIKVLGRREGGVAKLEAARQRMRAALYQRGIEEETRRYLERLRERAVIEYKVAGLAS